MTDADILAILKSDLGEIAPNAPRLSYLEHSIAAARQLITREGVTLGDSIEDGQLVVMYAAYLIRKRATGDAMPRMLRYALNNRLFAEKSGGAGNGA